MKTLEAKQIWFGKTILEIARDEHDMNNGEGFYEFGTQHIRHADCAGLMADRNKNNLNPYRRYCRKTNRKIETNHICTYKQKETAEIFTIPNEEDKLVNVTLTVHIQSVMRQA